ncbi:transposase [Pseudonocardia bannensis]|uniref:transposase n=1 Tax=Pseudonocardia bannensis TaxID=630973 RepID=UPI0028AC051F|nr:transposase [Pseudonocardia bannensis]
MCTIKLGRWALGELTRFRHEFYTALTARADVLFELTDAVLCADGPVRMLVDLALVAGHRRGHGAMYDALSRGRREPDRFGRTRASLPLPRAADGRIVLAVDVSPWLRSDAPTSADRLFCHVHGRARNQAQLIPGWPSPSPPPWSRAAPRGPPCRTRSASDPPTTPPR